MGVFYDKQTIDSTAEKWYNKSLRVSSQDRYLVASNYRNIGEIYFRNAEYKKAGNYYDSTLVQLDNRTREYRRLKKKRDNLEDVIKYETIAHENDSILSILAMDEKERNNYFEIYIKKIKAEDELKAKIAAEKAELEAIKEANLSASNPNNVSLNTGAMPPGIFPPGKEEEQSTFYFYNPVTVSYGKKDFQSKWGKRPLKENWKFVASKNTSVTTEDENSDNNNTTDSIENTVNKPEYEVSFYLSKLPTRPSEIDTLARDRNFAYFQLGSIYKEKFKEYELAANRLEQLLKNNPEERLILPAKYNLFKIYEILDPKKAESYKAQIIAEYPDSRYAQILKNPALDVDDDEARPEVVFNKLYKKYTENELREVFIAVQERIEQYLGEESLPKFEMLKANVIGRLQGVEEYKKALNYVSLTYPNTAEGKEAEALLQNHIPKLEALDFKEEQSNSWKLVFPKKAIEEEESKNKLLENIDKYLVARRNDDLKRSVDIYTMEDDFVVIHGFITEEVAKATLSVLQEYKDYKIKDKVYTISSEDYKIIQVKKKLEEWIK